MKTYENESALLIEQKEPVTSCAYRVFIFERLGEIVSYNEGCETSDVELNINGRIESVGDDIITLNTGDFVLVESKDRSFQDEFIVDSTPVYDSSSGTTNITLSMQYKYENGFYKSSETHSAFTDDEIGALVYKRIEVTEDVIAKTLKNINFKQEGDNLGEYMAAIANFNLRNIDYKYNNPNNHSGIFFFKQFTGDIDTFNYGTPSSDVIDVSSSWKNNLGGSMFKLMSGSVIGNEYMIIDSVEASNKLHILNASSDIAVGDRYMITLSRRKLVKIVAGYRDLSHDWYLIFGGIIRQDGFKTSDDGSVIKINSYGHLKDLEKDFAYKASNDEGILRVLSGVTITQVTRVESQRLHLGPKKLSFKFPADDGIPGVTPESFGTWQYNLGVKNRLLEFKPPNYFRFDGGAWTAKAAGSSTLTAKDGIVLNCTFSGEYDVVNRAELLAITSEDFPILDKRGTASIQLDEGSILNIDSRFERALYYDNGAGTYTAIEVEIDDESQAEVATFQAANDEIYLLSRQPFYGITVRLGRTTVENPFNGTVEFQYGQGYTWVALTVNDGTNGFTQDGDIIWDALDAWRPFDQDFGGSIGYVENVYGVRIRCTAFVANQLNLFMIVKYHRLYSNSGFALDVNINYRLLPPESVLDYVIIKQDSNDNLIHSFWWNYIKGEKFIEKLADEAGISTSFQTLKEMDVSLNDPTISSLGKAPNIGYRKNSRCVYYDEVDDILYVGIGNELWKLTDEGYEYLATLNPYVGKSGWTSGAAIDYSTYSWDIEIWRMERDASGNIQGIALLHAGRSRYAPDAEDHNYRSIFGRNTPAIGFKYNIASGSFTADVQLDEDVPGVTKNGWSRFVSGERCFRRGSYYGAVSPALSFWFVGRSHDRINIDIENVCVPIPQFIPKPMNNVGSTAGGYSNILMDESDCQWGDYETIANIWSATKYIANVYGNPIPPGTSVYNNDMGFGFSLGQDGFSVYDYQNDRWFVVENPNEAGFGVATIQFNTFPPVFTSIWNAWDYNYNVLCGDGPDYNASPGVTSIYMAEIGWVEYDNIFNYAPSYCRIIRVDDTGVAWILISFHFWSGPWRPMLGSVGGDWEFVTIITMVFDPDGNTLHGTCLVRNTMQYHYYVYDMTNSIFYSSQTGSNFTFDVNRQFIKGRYNSYDRKVYWYWTDQRYREKGAALVTGEFINNEIVLTYLTDIRAADWNAGAFLCEGRNGSMFGATAPNNNIVFEYSTIYNVRLMDTSILSYASIREAIQEIISLIGYKLKISPERHLTTADRFEYDTIFGSVTRELLAKVGRSDEYRFTYDGIVSDWSDEFDESGAEQFGDTGVNKKIFTLDNIFVQDKFMAKVLIERLWILLNNKKRALEDYKLTFVHQLELWDVLNFIVSDQFVRHDSSQNWLIEQIVLNLADWILKLKLIEIESAEAES